MLNPEAALRLVGALGRTPQMKLSLVLPSLFPNAFKRTVDNIVATTRGVDYEILAVTPFEAAGANVRWIREDTPRGVIPAHAKAYEHMAGDVLVALSDDALLVDAWADGALASLVEQERHAAFVCLGLHQTNLIVGTVFGIYYPFYAVARKSVLQHVGGHFDPAYSAHLADPDLGLRIWRAGGRCARTEWPLISRVAREGSESVNPPARTGANWPRDLATFSGRWASVYGQGWDMTSLRGFNLDVDALFELTVGQGRSIYFNDPLFSRLHANYQANLALLQASRQAQAPTPP